MRVLIAVRNLTGGGAERVASLWANGFADRGHHVSVVTYMRKNDKVTYMLHKDICIFSIYNWLGMKLWWFLHNDYIMQHRFRRIIKNDKPDVIICVLPPWGRWAIMATKGMEIPIINTEHNSFETPVSAPMTSQMLHEKYVENKDYKIVTVLTEADRKLTIGKLDNVVVLPNPLTFNTSGNIDNKKCVILAAGRLSAWHYKGFDLLINAWGKVAKKHPNWTLRIAGTGSIESQRFLKEVAAKTGIDKQIDFLGFCDNMLPQYQEASIFVLSSRYEGFGMVLIEAMSQGCAPIACDYKGRQRDIIRNEEEGICCNVEDVNGLSDAIEKMISDDNYRHSVQRKAIARSKDFSLDHIMDGWAEILKTL